MLKKWMLTNLLFISVAALSGVALAQDNASTPRPKRASASSYHQFYVGGSFFKTFVSSTTGMGLTQTPSDGMGGLFEARYLKSPLVGFELGISFADGGQAYTPVKGACGLTCQNPPVTITGKQMETSIDWVPSIKIGNLRPFLVGGLGIFVSIPDNTPLGNNTSIRGAYVYGGGMDFDLTSHLGIRGQFRGTM